MTKISNHQKKIKKEEFMNNYSALLIEKFYPNIKIFQHFIKIDIDGVECHYYPGAERINRKWCGNQWSDLNHADFLNLLQIPFKGENFSSREEVLLLKRIGLFNGEI